MVLAIAYMRFAIENQSRWEAVFKFRRPANSEVPASYLEDQAQLLSLIEAAIGNIMVAPVQRAKAARALFGAVHGIVALAIDNRLGGQLRVELEEQVRFIVDIVARGLPSIEAVVS